MNCCPICHNEIAEGDVTRVKVTLPNGDYYIETTCSGCVDEHKRKTIQDAEDHSNIVTGEFELKHEHDMDTYSLRLISACNGTPALRTIIPGETARELAREILTHEAVTGEQEWPERYAATSGERSDE